MSNFPAPREIPQGKVLLAEYGGFHASKRAIVQTVASAHSTKIRAAVSLVASSPGFEVAGSVARWTNRYFAVRWTNSDGAIMGQRYRNDGAGEAGAGSLRPADGDPRESRGSATMIHQNRERLPSRIADIASRISIDAYSYIR